MFANVILEEPFKHYRFFAEVLDLTVAFGGPVGTSFAHVRSARVKVADPAMAHRPSRCYGAPMAAFLSKFLLPVAIGAVALVLLLGLVNLMRGGSPNRSQQLMRLRVLLQFVAVVVIMLTIWAMGR
jgi:hypothetical protein